MNTVTVPSVLTNTPEYNKSCVVEQIGSSILHAYVMGNVKL